MLNAIKALNIPDDAKRDVQDVTDTLLEKFPSNIRKIILFGSYATGKYQPDSDIDLAVVLNALPEPKERRRYKQAVEIDRDIDLLFCTEAQLLSDTYVYKRINEGGIALYEQL